MSSWKQTDVEQVQMNKRRELTNPAWKQRLTYAVPQNKKDLCAC